MQAKSWAKIAAYPERRVAESSPRPEPDLPGDIDSGNCYHCENPIEGPHSPGIEVTEAELEAGVKFSWSTNPAHLVRKLFALWHPEPSLSSRITSPNFRSFLHLLSLPTTPTLPSQNPTIRNKHNNKSLFIRTPSLSSSTFRLASSDLSSKLEDSSPSASDEEGGNNKKLKTHASKAQASPKLPTFSLSPVVTMFSTMGNSEDTLTTDSEHLFDNQHAQPRASVFNMNKRHPETPKKAAPSVTTHPSTGAIAPHLQSFGDQSDQKHRVANNNSQLGSSPVKTHQFDGAAPPFHASSTLSSPSKSAHNPQVSLPTTPRKPTGSSASTQDTLLADTVKSKSRIPGTMGSPKTPRRDETRITVQNFPITVKNFSVTRDRLPTRNTDAQIDLIANRSELSQSTDSSPTCKATPDFKGKGKERYIERDADKTADIFEPVGSTSTYVFGPGPPRLSSSSQDSDKTITPSDFIRGDPNKTPTLPIRAKDMLRQLTISDSNIAGPSSQNVVSRLGSTTYSAVPDDEQDWPHTSGLNYDERCAVLKSHVEAMEDRKRAQVLMNADPDCADVVLFTKHHLKGIQEVRYHREVILKDSGYMARIMPPPNDDGSSISMFMGTWPIAMIRKVFDFMYHHTTPGCEPPKDDLFYHMSPAWVNYHCFLLACAFECNRQQGYNTRNLRKIVERAEKQTRGSYATYQLAYWEFSQCEEALRDLVRIAFKEKGYQEAQRPMRVLVARLVAVMVPWILRGKYMGPIMVPLWFEMKEEYLPWREMLWRYIATGEVQSPDWAWLGEPMSELQITTALSRFGAGF